MTEIRVDRVTDSRRYLATDQLVWFSEVLDHQPLEEQLDGVPEEHRFAAETDEPDADPATYAGIYGVRPMELTVPGPGGAGGSVVPVAGLTWVGVHPDQRRRGILTAMLRHHFEQTRREGVALSALHASEHAIYGRHGYGTASLEHEVKVGRGTTFTAPGLEDRTSGLTIRLASMTDDGMTERLRDCDRRTAPHEVGTIVGGMSYYDAVVREQPEQRRDKEVRRVLFARRDGQDVGFGTFRREHHWDNGRPGAKVTVGWLHGEPAVRLALARRLVDLDLAGTITFHGLGIDDPMVDWVGGVRGTGSIQAFDSLWVRLVSLPEALALRGYAADCDVVVDVADTAAPWNAGTWRIHVSGGEVACERSDDAAEVSLPVQALGAAYLGWGVLAGQLRSGLVTEHRPGAVLELHRAMRTDVPPVAAVGF